MRGSCNTASADTAGMSSQSCRRCGCMVIKKGRFKKMRITDLLDERSISLTGTPKTKSEALDQIVDLMVKSGKISSGHARALVTIDNKEFLINLAKQIVQYKMTVRDVEDRVRLYETRKNIPSGPRKTQPLTLELKELVSDMKRVFGTRVKLVGTPEKGRFSIDYFSKDDLERIYQLVEILKKDNN